MKLNFQRPLECDFSLFAWVLCLFAFNPLFKYFTYLNIYFKFCNYLNYRMGTPETETDCSSSCEGEIVHSVMAVVLTQIRNVQLVVQQTNYHQRGCNGDGLDGILFCFC